MAQEGGEPNWSDLSANGYGKMHVLTPSSCWLETYLPQENADESVAELWHFSSVCAVHPTGHNSNTLQQQFDVV